MIVGRCVYTRRWHCASLLTRRSVGCWWTGTRRGCTARRREGPEKEWWGEPGRVAGPRRNLRLRTYSLCRGRAHVSFTCPGERGVQPAPASPLFPGVPDPTPIGVDRSAPLPIRQLISTTTTNRPPGHRLSDVRGSGYAWPPGCRSLAESPTRLWPPTPRTVDAPCRTAPGLGESATRRARPPQAQSVPCTRRAPARRDHLRRPSP